MQPVAPADSGVPIFSLLHRAGLRATSARIFVLQALQRYAPQAVPAEQVFMAVNAQGVQLSLGSIYRVLNEMQRCGLVLRELAAEVGGKSGFALASTTPAPSAYQLVCPACGTQHKVTDKLFVEAVQRQARLGGFDAGLETISISLRCNACCAVR